MQLLANISISRKIFGGFALILVLLAGVGGVSYFGLSDGNTAFGEYRSLALQTNQAGRVQANVLATRLASKDFIIKQTDVAIAAVRERASASVGYADDLVALATSDGYRQTAETISSDLKDYETAFGNVVEAQELRDQQVNTVLNTTGPVLRKKLSEIMDSAFADGDPEAAYYAGKAQQHLLLARLYVFRFLDDNTAGSAERVRDEFAEFDAQYERLVANLQNPIRRELAAEAADLKGRYLSGFEATVEAINTRNSFIHGTLDKIGPRVADQIEQMKLDVKAQQDVLGPQTVENLETTILTAEIIVAVALGVGGLAAWLIGTGISRPIVAITGTMTCLSAGDKTVDVPGLDRRDEVGDMAQAVQVFKDKMVEADRLAEEEKETQKRRAERARKMEALAQAFDASIGQVLDNVTTSASCMQETAGTMKNTAEQTSAQATAAAGASEQAATNVQMVATAAEELTASIREINSNVATSTEIAQSAVREAEETNTAVRGLAEAAQQIEVVVSLINDIADQTNMLALNATIEAARAGDAGKGFVVVAAEVKSLANQTAEATQEISSQIKGVQLASQNSVHAIGSITSTISRMNEISAAIASAIEEQQASTSEIARNVEQAAAGTSEVSTNVGQVNCAADETGEAANSVKSASEGLSREATELQTIVEKFLGDVKAA